MFIFSFLLIWLTTTTTMHDKATLIYVGDPMCSWCYGVSKEMSKVKNHFAASHDFQLVMGGLRPDNKETMVDLKEFLTHHWEEVAQRSGLPFSYDILNNTEITYDTEPPCRAVVVVRALYPDKAFTFFKEVQKSFYLENKNMHLVESYQNAIEKIDGSFEEFKTQFNSLEAKENVRKDFSAASNMGVHGFPTLLLKSGNDITVIANGYAPSERMISAVSAVMD